MCVMVNSPDSIVDHDRYRSIQTVFLTGGTTLQGELTILKQSTVFYFYKLFILYCSTWEFLDVMAPGNVYSFSGACFLDTAFLDFNSRCSHTVNRSDETHQDGEKTGCQMLYKVNIDTKGTSLQCTCVWVCMFWTLSWPRWPSDPLASWKQCWVLQWVSWHLHADSNSVAVRLNTQLYRHFSCGSVEGNKSNRCKIIISHVLEPSVDVHLAFVAQ